MVLSYVLLWYSLQSFSGFSLEKLENSVFLLGRAPLIQTLKGFPLGFAQMRTFVSRIYMYALFPHESYSVFSRLFPGWAIGPARWKPPPGLHGAARWAYPVAIMETLDYWTPADALAFRCSVAEVGTLRPECAALPLDAAPMDAALRPDVADARRYAPRAMRALVRIMESDAPAAALGAAREILARAYGPAAAPAAPPAAPAAPADAAPADAAPALDWLSAQRLAYKAGEYSRANDCLSNDCHSNDCTGND